MSSSRLPGKVLTDIAGRPMLAWVVERSMRARTVDSVVVATTTDPADEAVAALCQTRGYACYRGSLNDVLDRCYQAARLYKAEAIVRITGDCPLMDAGVIDDTVDAFLGKSKGKTSIRLTEWPPGPRLGGIFPYDFATNRLPPPWHRTYPIGLDVEVCTLQALEYAWSHADRSYQREHVMPYLYEEEGRFRVLLVDHEPDYGWHRWTVDTVKDLELIRLIYSHLGGRIDFSWQEVLALFDRQPELAAINAQVRAKHFREA